MDASTDTASSFPENLLSFEEEELLQLECPNSEFDLDSLFNETPISPDLSDISTSECNTDSSTRSHGYSVSSDEQLSPKSSDSSSGIYSSSPEAQEVAKTYTELKSVFLNATSNQNRREEQSQNIIGHNIQPVLLHHPGLVAKQVNQPLDNEITMESEDDDDDCDPIFQGMSFSGKDQQSLPTYFSVGNTSPNFTATLTTEERQLLAKEGIRLPENMPLTKMEERALRRVRRKIRNKNSAQLSRLKKKDYVKSLEERVKKCTETNFELQKKVENLEMQNNTLMQQLSALQTLITNKLPSYPQTKTAQATTGTCLMMVVFSVCLLVFPNANPFTSPETPEVVSYNHLMPKTSVNSRVLLNFDTKNFESSVDPEETFEIPLNSVIEEMAIAATDEEALNETEYVSAVEKLEDSTERWKDGNIPIKLNARLEKDL